MEKENKVRILCTNCLYSKVLPIHESDPKGTRIIVSGSCEKCWTDSDGALMYFDDRMNEISEQVKPAFKCSTCSETDTDYCLCVKGY